MGFIDLTENKLTTLKRGTFDFLSSDELTVELWENPFNCDCNLQWLKRWIESVRKTFCISSITVPPLPL